MERLAHPCVAPVGSVPRLVCKCVAPFDWAQTGRKQNQVVVGELATSVTCEPYSVIDIDLHAELASHVQQRNEIRRQRYLLICGAWLAIASRSQSVTPRAPPQR